MHKLVQSFNRWGFQCQKVHELLKAPDIQVNLQDRFGQSALHYACRDNIKSHFGVQLLLSDTRCDVNLLDSSGDSIGFVAHPNVPLLGISIQDTWPYDEFPNFWGHAVLNLGETVGYANEFEWGSTVFEL